MNTVNILSAGTLKNNKVIDVTGEEIGKIEEIMLDTNHGTIAYAVLSFGGFMGFGDKYFAIPWDTLELNKEEHNFLLNVPKEQLENAPGFDKNNWPGTPDKQYVADIFAYYGKNRYWDK